MRPIEVHSVSMSFAPMVARLNSDGSVFFGTARFRQHLPECAVSHGGDGGHLPIAVAFFHQRGIAQSRTIGTRGVYAPDAVEDGPPRPR